MNKFKVEWKKGLLSFLFVALLLASGCMREGFCGRSGIPAIQLLPAIGLGTLRDNFCDMGPLDNSAFKPELTFLNKTNGALAIFLYETDGTKYDFKLSPGAEDTYSLKAGAYRAELIVAGHPSMSVEKLIINSGEAYQWEIFRKE